MESLSFIDWKTKKEKVISLSNSNPIERKTDLICPYDKTRILFYYNALDKGFYCPNCRTEYNLSIISQEEVNSLAKQNILEMTEKIDKQKEKLKNLEEFVNFAKLAFR